MLKRFVLVLLLVAAVHGLFVPAARSQAKLAQTGFQFLSVGTDARATGMGEAVTTVEGSSAAMFYNPAGLASVGSFVDLSVSQVTWVADIKYFSGSAAFAPVGGRYGVVGVTFLKVNYGDFKFTSVANNEQGYVDLQGYPEPYAYAVGLAYAKKLSEQFSVGGVVKYAYQNLGSSLIPVIRQVTVDSVTSTDTTLAIKDYSLNVPVFDFGTIYRTGLKSLAFGMSINNFSREIAYERESFQLPLTFKFGISFNLMDLAGSWAENNSFLVSIDAVHPRSFPEFLNIGGEYVFMRTLALRAGYVTKHDDYGLTVGIGVSKFGFAFDYSYTPHKYLADVHRLSARFSL